MNANQLINMAMHFLVKPLIGRGIEAGITKFGQGGRAEGQKPDPRAKANIKRAQKSMKIGQRFGRF